MAKTCHKCVYSENAVVHVHVTVLGHSEGTLSNRIFKTGL